MKKSIVILFMVLILVTGCGNKSNTVTFDQTAESTVVASESELEKETISKSEEVTQENEVATGKDVDIILPMLSMNMEEKGIEDYVENLKKENPGNTYSVYNEEYYIQTMKESERKEALAKLKDDELVGGIIKDIFEDSDFEGIFIKCDYDDLFQNVTFNVNKEKYMGNQLMVNLSVAVVFSQLGEATQAYSLIQPENRIFKLVIIDDVTNEVLYDSTQENSKEE